MSDFMQVLWFLSFLVIPCGILSAHALTRAGKSGLESPIDGIIWVGWLLGAICSIPSIPYNIWSTIIAFQMTMPSWNSYQFGIYFAAWFVLALMTVCVIMPTIEVVRWRTRTK
mgnify:CR=1 FL=1